MDVEKDAADLWPSVYQCPRARAAAPGGEAGAVAETCLGTFVLPLASPHESASRCGVDELVRSLFDEEIAPAPDEATGIEVDR